MRVQSGINSYVTLSEANRYFTIRPHASDWGDTSVASVVLTFSASPQNGNTIIVDGNTLTFVTPTIGVELESDEIEIYSDDLKSTLWALLAALPPTVEGEVTGPNTVKLTYWLAGIYGNGTPISWAVTSSTIKAGNGAASASGSATFTGGASTKSDLTKGAALILACRHIESGYLFKGRITASSQKLSWPRSDVYDKNGRAIDPLITPDAVKNAQCELAAQWIAADQLMPAATFMTKNDSDFTKGGVKRIKLGTLEKEYRDTGSYLHAIANGEAPSTKLYPFIDMMLGEFSLKSPSGTSGRITI